MTTAHRPTYNSTKGGSLQGGNKLYNPSLQYSSKDLPGFTNLKRRQVGQGTKGDLKKKDFKADLLKREMKSKNDDKGEGNMNELGEDSSNINADITSDLFEEPQKKRRLDSSESEIKSQSQPQEAKPKEEEKTDNNNVFEQDKDISFDEDDDENHKEKDQDINKENKNEDEDDDEDSEEELMREYEKIKKMREEEEKKKEQEMNEKLKAQTQDQILMGNPLLNQASDYSLKKKWFEDTVFKNQTKNEPKTKKRFVNDTVRSDFHRKFLNKTIQ
jgi:protein CWC15